MKHRDRDTRKGSDICKRLWVREATDTDNMLLANVSVGTGLTYIC
jgi:hypothetical protein